MDYANANEIPWSLDGHGVKYVMQGPNVEWGLLKLQSGQSSAAYGRHVHKEVEETFYFLEGTPRFVIAGKEHRVRPGDAFRVAGGESHDLINDTDSDTVAVFIKWPYDPGDRVEE